MLIGSHGAGSNGIIFDDLDLDLDLDLFVKVTVYLQVEYLKNGAFYGQNY